MRRLVIRFKDGSTTSLDLVPGREREDLLRHLRHFLGKEVASVERPRKLRSWEVRRWVGIPMRRMASLQGLGEGQAVLGHELAHSLPSLAQVASRVHPFPQGLADPLGKGGKGFGGQVHLGHT